MVVALDLKLYVQASKRWKKLLQIFFLPIIDKASNTDLTIENI